MNEAATNKLEKALRQERSCRSYSIAVVAAGCMAVALLAWRCIVWPYSFPMVYSDEASFLSPALELARNGRMSTTVHAPFLAGASRFTFWMPPVYVLSLAGFLRVVGVSLVRAKVFSLLSTVVAAISLVRIAGTNEKSGLGAAAWYLTLPHVLMSAFVVRMEAFCCLTILLAGWYVSRRDKLLFQTSLLLGALAALPLLAHPLGGGAAVGAFVIVTRNGKRAWAGFLVGATLCLGLWALYIGQAPSLFWQQFAPQFLRKAGSGPLSPAYFLQCIAVAAPGLVMWGIGRRFDHTATYALFGLAATWAVVLLSKEFNYHVYLAPYSAMLLATQAPCVSGRPRYLRLGVFLGGLFMALTLLALKVVIHRPFDVPRGAYSECAARVAAAMPSGTGCPVFVTGNPDFAGYLMCAGVWVERMNAVASAPWANVATRYETIVLGRRLPPLHTPQCPSAFPYDSAFTLWRCVSDSQWPFAVSIYRRQACASHGGAHQETGGVGNGPSTGKNDSDEDTGDP